MSTSINRIKQMIEDVNSSNKNNDKLEALRKYDDIKKYIELIYDPMIQFNLTSKTLKKNELIDEEFEFEEMDIFNILIDLNKRVFTGHKAIGVVNKYVSQFPDNKQLVYLMLDKNLKIRMSISLINKAFDGLIKEFKVKLANSYKDTMSLDFDKFNYYASRKLDGCRCITVVKEDEIKIYSRTGKEFLTLDKIKNAIRNNITMPKPPYVLDGEVCIVDEDDNEDFAAIMKLIKKKDFTIDSPRYKVFDILKIEDFENHKSEEIFSERIKKLNKIKDSNKTLDIVEQIIIDDQGHLEQMIKEADELGYEGTMLQKDVIYEGKRSNNLLKVKKFKDKEFKVLSTENSEIRYIDYDDNGVAFEKSEVMLKSVVVKHKGNNVSVGSGFSIEQRRRFYENPELIIGKIITVKYFETTIVDGIESLRFPTLKVIHGDKRTT